jgi:glyoxylase-like metal-dependent hydrolase (beta-lactamase superfamily II)
MSCEIWQLAPQTHTQMMGYVIRADGQLIVIDGGTAGDAPYLLRLLQRVGGPRPRVSAWFLTHPHADHIDAFTALVRQHGDDFSLDRVCLRFPTRALLEKGEPGCLHTFDEYQALRPRFAARECLLEEGQTFAIGPTRWEVLYVSDPTFTHNASNNSSSVLRLTAEGVRVLFLGDLGVEGGEKLLRNHGDELKSDLVQMAHHGQGGVSMDVYRAAAPSMCLWCAPKWLYDNNQGCRGFDSGEWDILRVRAEMRRLGVRRNVVAKDGTAKITLENGGAQAVCWDPFAAQ